MQKRKPGKGATIRAGRVTRFLLAAVLCSPATLLFPTRDAHGLEIFGWTLFGSDDDAEDVVDPLNYSVAMTVEGGDAELEEALNEASSLVQDAERPVSGSLGLLAKARSDRERLVAALYSRARYDGVVDITIEGRSIDDLPPDAQFGAGPVPVAISIDPGMVFTLGAVALRGDAADLEPAEFGLVPGGDASSDAVLKAEAEVVRRLKEEGRPLAEVTGSDVVADHATATLAVTLTVEAGPIAGYGETFVSGTETMDPGFTAYVAGLRQGETFSPQDIEDARDRLLALGVFSSVTIKEGDTLDANGNVPINVEVSERKLRYYGVGATVSNIEGLGLEGYWGHRNLFGRAETLRIEGSVGRISDTADVRQLNYNAAILFEKPGVLGPDSKFFANVRTVFEHPDAYDRFSTKASAGLSYQFTREQSASAELSIDYTDIEDFYNPEGKRHLIVSAPLRYVYDSRDDKLNPTEGFRAVAFAEPAYDILNGATFVKVRGDLSAYRALDEAGKFILAGRAAVGSIVGADIEDIPADRRFYAGGGGSVRGYPYQGIGPKAPDGQPTGGRSLVEGAVEVRIRIRDNIAIVPFIDGGSVSTSESPDFANFAFGAGIGLRYLTPFGPLRLDVAVPLDRQPGDPSFGIYAGVGQAF